jgi:hypothetical protein
MTMVSGEPVDERVGVLRSTARIAAAAGLAGAVGSMLWVGRRNDSYLLLAVFAIWVSWPFVMLLATQGVFARTWRALTRVVLDVLMIATAAGTLAAYASVALGPPRARSAFLFVLVPPVSMVIVAVCLSAAALIARRTRQG